MKALIILSALFLAGVAPAQSPEVERSLESRVPRGLRDRPQMYHPESPYEIQGSRFTYGGLGVELAKSPNPLTMFNPFDSDNFEGPTNNTVRDERFGRPLGWSLLRIKF